MGTTQVGAHIPHTFSLLWRMTLVSGTETIGCT